MNRVTKPDPEMDPSVLQKMAYESSYTEAISKQMRVPSTITVAEPDDEIDQSRYNEMQQTFYRTSNSESEGYKRSPALSMEVPDRIIVSVGESGIQYQQGDAPLPTAADDRPLSPSVLALRTPPRVLTLQERNLDSLDIDTPEAKQSDEEKSAENTDIRNTISDQSSDQSLEDMDDIVQLKKQVFKLHRRLNDLEQQQARRSRTDLCVYGVTVIFWLLNGWFLYSHRRLY